MENKKQFVEAISQAIVGNVPSIEKVEYEKYHRADKNWTQEYIVVYYTGGAIGVRSVSATSCGAIFQEIGKLLFGGYYQEVEDRQHFIDSPEWTRVE